MKVMKQLILGVQWLLFVPFLHATSFTTISQAQAYAKRNPEYVKPDNKDWLHPDFHSFHNKMMPNIMQRLWMRLGFSTKVWNVHTFEKLLQEVTTQREATEFKGEFGQRFTPSSDDKCIIWGDLYGAFHSLVRDLTFLKQQKIIDNNLKIKPHYYFVFNGNVIEGSPYIAETLTLVLHLMQANPTQVIYTRGYHESKERWQNFELMNEFKIRVGPYTEKYDEISNLLERFFQSLPIGVYVTKEKANEVNIVVISSNDKISQRFDPRSIAGLLEIKNRYGYFYYKESLVNGLKKKFDFRAFITGEDRSISYHLTQGLTLIGAIKGALRWMVFSSPTERNQKLYKFDYDAFVQLNMNGSINKWTLTLFHQKVPELKGFIKAVVYDLISGHTVREDISHAKDLFFGSTMDLSKGASPIGKRVEEGLQLAFDKARSEKTVPNIMPRLTTVNDEYTPLKTRAAVEDFIKKGITLLIGSQGSASLEAYLDLIEDDKVLVMFPLTGAPEFRKPNLSHLIHYRGSYIREGEELIKYALKDLKARRVAIFYQDDAFGRGALEGARRALKAAGITDFLEVPHERNVVNYVKQANIINDYNPDTILFSTNTLAIRGLIRQMGVQYFAGKNLLGISVYEDAFERFLKDKGLSFILIRVVPDPKDSQLEIAKEYRKWADAYNLSYDKVAFEQFINATILFEILQHIKPPITKEKIITFAEKMHHYPLKGLELNFNPETRELSDTMWIDPGNDREWIKKSTLDVEARAKIVKTKELAFASLMDLSKGVRTQGKAVKAGIELRLREASENKQMQKVPTITVVDDQYDPKITKQEIEKLMKEGIDLIVCPMGSPTLESYLDLVKQKKIAVLFPITGAPIFRSEDLTNIINLRASYATEGKVLSQYALDSMGAQKIVLLYQNDAFGKGLLDAAHELFKERTMSTVLDISYERLATDFTQQVKKAQEFNPDTILFFSTATAARNFIRQFDVGSATKLKMLGNSDMGEATFLKFVKDTGLQFVYVSVMPNPRNSTLPIVQQYREASKQQNVPVDVFSLEAYIGVDLLLEVIQTIKGDLTKDAIVAMLASFTAKEYKGLTLNFNAKDRTLLHTLWLNKGTPEWQMIQT